MNFTVYSQGEKFDGSLPVEGWHPEEVGVFESLRTYGRKIFRQEEHLRRFMDSARTAGLDTLITSRQIKKELDLALASFLKEKSNDPKRNLFLRVTLLRGKVWVMIGERKHSPLLYEKGVALRTSPVRRSFPGAFPAGAKTTAYQNALLASLEPKSSEIYEWVFLDGAGYVTEVSIGNLFIVQEGGLVTPPTSGILNGVTRRFVIECSGLLGIPVKEAPLTRHEIYNAGEAFLTNTSWEMLPIRALDGRRIAEKIPGPLTQKLHHTFKERAKKECQ